MGRKMRNGQPLLWFAITLTVVFLSTFIVWVWPDSSLWVLGVILVLCVLGVTWAYRISLKETPPNGSQTKGTESSSGEIFVGRKMTDGQALVGLSITLTVLFLNTWVVWRWPDASLWVFGVVLLLSVLGVLWAHGRSRKGTPPTDPQTKEQESSMSSEG